MSNELAHGLFSDGTNPLVIDGIPSQISDNPAIGRPGRINRAEHEFWRNKVTSTARVNITTAFRRMYNRLVRNADNPDLIVTDLDTYNAYEDAIEDVTRVKSDQSMADIGFDNIKLKNTIITHDAYCPAGRAYFLNCDYFMLRTHPKRNMTASKVKEVPYQDATIQHIQWAGNLTMSNASLQGVAVSYTHLRAHRDS